MDDLVSEYVEYMKETESPYVYHRWSAIATIGALIGRNYYLPHGHFRIFPNLYCLLLGDPASRKSTAIKLARKLTSASGYKTFASTKSSKEQFLHDLELSSEEGFGLEETGNKDPGKFLDTTTDKNLWGEGSEDNPREVFIVADEFSEFSGIGQAEFYTTLGNLWDWDDETDTFKLRLKNSKSVSIYQPTVSILGGTTPSKFAKIFPPEIMDDGFLSRIIIVGGERSDRKYPDPPEPDSERTNYIISRFKAIREANYGRAILDSEAKEVIAELYHNWPGLSDARFKSYNSRRDTQIRKLALISAISRGIAPNVTGYNIIEANTWLTAVEAKMASAVGEFGKSKHSDTANRIMEIINSARHPVTAKELYIAVSRDLERSTQLGEITQGLALANKIQLVNGGWLPKREVFKKDELVDWDLLTDEEQL